MVAERLHIAPSQHTEDAFRRILGGCTSVVEGLGTLRNKIGDAHGKGGKPVRAAPRLRLEIGREAREHVAAMDHPGSHSRARLQSGALVRPGHESRTTSLTN